MFSSIFNFFFKKQEQTNKPVEEPTNKPVEEPTNKPVEEPTNKPVELVEEPTNKPVELVEEPTNKPVEEPTNKPVEEPTNKPVEEPTNKPVEEVISNPVEPVEELTNKPDEKPTNNHVEPVEELVTTPVEPVEELVTTPVEEAETTTVDEVEKTNDREILIGVTEIFNKCYRGMLYEELDILLKNAYSENPLYTLRCMAYIRDNKKGRGERELSKKIYRWLETNCEDQLIKNMELFINKYGRWDDFIYLPLGKRSSIHYLNLICKQLRIDLENMKKREKTSEIAKWIPSEKSKGHNHKEFNNELAKSMKINCAELRKTYLTPLRKYICESEEERREENEQILRKDNTFEEMMNILSDPYFDDIECVEMS